MTHDLCMAVLCNFSPFYLVEKYYNHGHICVNMLIYLDMLMYNSSKLYLNLLLHFPAFRYKLANVIELFFLM